MAFLVIELTYRLSAVRHTWDASRDPFIEFCQ